MDLANLEKMDRDALFLEIIKKGLDDIDTYIVGHEKFRETYLKTKDLYETIKKLNISFTLKDIWKMNNALLNYIYEGNDVTNDQELKTKVSIILYKDYLLDENDEYIVEKNNYRKIMSNAKSLNNGILKLETCELNDIDDSGEFIDPITFENIDENSVGVINRRCYNKSTINSLYYNKEFENITDPFTRKNAIVDYIKSMSFEFLAKHAKVSVTHIDDFSSKKLTTIPDLDDNVKAINISNNKLKSFNMILSDSLTCIDASNNLILKIDQMSDLIHICFLNSNKIEKIENLGKNVSVLNLSFNKITKIENLDNELFFLNLDNNKIEQIENLNGVVYLFLKNNKITNVDLNLLTKIHVLDLRNNPIENKREVIDYCLAKNIHLEI